MAGGASRLGRSSPDDPCMVPFEVAAVSGWCGWAADYMIPRRWLRPWQVEGLPLEPGVVTSRTAGRAGGRAAIFAGAPDVVWAIPAIRWPGGTKGGSR